MTGERAPASPAPRRRSHFGRYTQAWLAMMLSVPLVVTAATLGLTSEGAVASGYLMAMSTWGLPATIAGTMAWPLVRQRLQMAGEQKSLSRAALLLVFGLLMGAATGGLIGVFPMLVFALGGSLVLSFLGWCVLIGAATGLIWAGLFVGLEALEAWIERQKRT